MCPSRFARVLKLIVAFVSSMQPSQVMLLALLRGETGIYIDIEAAVIIRDADALDGAGQGDKADIVFEHSKLILTPLVLR